MNWVRQTLKYFGLYESADKQPLRDDFHHRSEDDLPKVSADSLKTIKTFTEKYPIEDKDKLQSADDTSVEHDDTLSIEANEQCIKDYKPSVSIQTESVSVLNSSHMDHIDLSEDSENLLSTSIQSNPHDHSTAELLQTEKTKKPKRLKKVRKRVTWAVRRSWKWIKRGWSGYAPGVATGMMYCTNAPTTLFNIK